MPIPCKPFFLLCLVYAALATVGLSLFGCGGVPKNNLPPVNMPVKKTEPPKQATKPAIKNTAGQRIFESNCLRCHYTMNETLPPVIARSFYTQSEASFTQFLRSPTSSMMPAFSVEDLPDEQVEALYQYIQEIQ
ncbi:MAG: cytochrome c [Cyanobacteria bacterium P01_H01_bin.74]